MRMKLFCVASMGSVTIFFKSEVQMHDKYSCTNGNKGTGFHFSSLPKYMFIDSRQGGREGERKGCKRETLICWLWHAPDWGTKPATRACTLTGNGTLDLLVYGMMLWPTVPYQPGQGQNIFKTF